MQKHEREALEIVRECVVPLGYTVELMTGRGHKRILVTTPCGARRSKPVSSSPGCKHVELDRTRRWVRKIVEELRCGG